MKEIKLFEQSFYDANALKCRIGTTGYCGGDSGHGCRTIFELEDLGGTDISATVSDSPSNGKIKIELGGDAELATFIKTLEFASSKLKEITGEMASVSYEEKSNDRTFISTKNRLINIDNIDTIQIDCDNFRDLICTHNDGYLFPARLFLARFNSKEQANKALQTIKEHIAAGTSIIDIEAIKKDIEDTWNEYEDT